MIEKKLNKFDELTNHQRLILSVVNRMSAGSFCKADIADVVQNINVKLMTGAMDNFNAERGSMESYIAVVAKSMFLDFCRANSRHNKHFAYCDIATHYRETDPEEAGGPAPATDGSWLMSELVLVTEDTLTMMLREEQRNKLSVVMDQLDQSDRDFIEMLTMDSYDHKTAAAKLGVSEGALRVRKCRLSDKLRKLLSEQQD